MIEISISRAFAAEHPGFMAGCAERGRQVDVFDDGQSGEQAPPAPAGRPGAGERTLPSMTTSAVLAAASPTARCLLGICDRCWQPGFVRETDRETIGLCEPCIDTELQRLRRLATMITEIVGA